MSNISTTMSPPIEAAQERALPPVQWTAWLAAAGAASRLAAWYARRRRIEHTIDALSGLSDHTLKDIGIHRSQILSVAHAAVDPTRNGR
jgi:uncharacterized protein YjiS (DUF1127 family)